MNKNLTAVALIYPQNADAPMIAAKGKAYLAQRMIDIAKENDVPVVEDELMANVLSVEEIGECIPENTWQAVAGIFAMIMELENK